jgi:hypothetical protein
MGVPQAGGGEAKKDTVGDKRGVNRENTGAKL